MTGEWQQAETLPSGPLPAPAAPGWSSTWAALLHAATARLAIHRGDVARARDDLARAERLGAGLTWALPHLAVQVRLELARNYLALTDAAAARTVLREVDDLLAHRPRLGILGDQAAALGAQLDAMRRPPSGRRRSPRPSCACCDCWAPTSRSWRSGSSRSHSTPKSQAMSIYRKFGMPSPGDAIRHARDLGLLVE